MTSLAPERLRRACLLVAAVLAAGCAGRPRVPPPHSAVGRMPDIVAPDLAGREVRVAPGDAALTVVDFWATWCEPCREQLPALDRIAARYRARGVEVYAIALDERREDVEAFVAERRVGFPVLWDRGGATLAGPLGITRLPTTFVIDGTGTVRAVHLGFGDGAEVALESELRALLSSARR